MHASSFPAVAGNHSCMGTALREGCCSGVGCVGVLGAVLAASVESDIVLHIQLSQLLLVQWCHVPAV